MDSAINTIHARWYKQENNLELATRRTTNIFSRKIFERENGAKWTTQYLIIAETNKKELARVNPAKIMVETQVFQTIKYEVARRKRETKDNSPGH